MNKEKNIKLLHGFIEKSCHLAMEQNKSCHDLYISVDAQEGLVSLQTEADEVLGTFVVYDFILPREKALEPEEEVRHLCKMKETIYSVIHELNQEEFFDKPFFRKPLSILFIDEKNPEEEPQELLFVDEDLIRIDDPLLANLDEDLDRFITDLLAQDE